MRACTNRGLPVETRRRIDGWRFREGLLDQRIDLNAVPGQPEAVYLLSRHTSHVCTFETPSEFGLALRVQAHVRFIAASLKLLALPATKKGAHPGF